MCSFLKAFTVCWLALLLPQAAAFAAEIPMVTKNNYVLKNFTFHTGETLPELTIHYRTMGDSSGIPVLVLHGTAGSGAAMAAPRFAGELFSKGQSLDAQKYFIIMPDAIGTGDSSKPSDGLRAQFPRYNYEDMVSAQYRLVTEGLKIKHLRVIIGNSMGGMHCWLWATKYPDFMDAIVPLASMPTVMSGRNWMMRRMIVDAVKNDPAWNNGNYTEQPQYFRMVNVWYTIATNGGTLAYLDKAPTSEAGDALVEKMMSNQTKMDANDFMFQWDSSRDYNPSPKLDGVKAHVLAVNSADDERCPAESGLMEKEMARLKNAIYYLIPGSTETSGHGTTMNVRFWSEQFSNFIKTVPEKNNTWR